MWKHEFASEKYFNAASYRLLLYLLLSVAKPLPNNIHIFLEQVEQAILYLKFNKGIK